MAARTCCSTAIRPDSHARLRTGPWPLLGCAGANPSAATTRAPMSSLALKLIVARAPWARMTRKRAERSLSLKQAALTVRHRAAPAPSDPTPEISGSADGRKTTDELRPASRSRSRAGEAEASEGPASPSDAPALPFGSDPVLQASRLIGREPEDEVSTSAGAT